MSSFAGLYLVAAFFLFGGSGDAHRSVHFELSCGADDRVARIVLADMEHTLDRVLRFCDRIGLKYEVGVDRIRGRVVCDERARSALRQPGMQWGVYDTNSGNIYLDPSIFAPGEVALSGPRLAALRLTVRHETAHLVLDRLLPRFGTNAPAWLAEGLACLFEHVPEDEADADTLPNAFRQADLRRLWSASRRNPAIEFDIVRVLESRDWPDVSGVSASKADKRLSAWYASCWAIVYYLSEREPACLADVVRMFNGAAEGADSTARAHEALRGAAGCLNGDVSSRVVRFALGVEARH